MNYLDRFRKKIFQVVTIGAQDVVHQRDYYHPVETHSHLGPISGNIMYSQAWPSGTAFPQRLSSVPAGTQTFAASTGISSFATSFNAAET
jgi:hypothetical protein